MLSREKNKERRIEDRERTGAAPVAAPPEAPEWVVPDGA